MSTDFTIHIHGESWDLYDDNVDVLIDAGDLGRYTATFFTLQNLASLFEKFRQSGECASGTYFWAVHMIVVQDLKEETIRKSVEDLIKNKEIGTALLRIG